MIITIPTNTTTNKTINTTLRREGKGKEGKGREGEGEGEGEGKVKKCKNVALGGLPVFVPLCLLGAPGHGGLANGLRMEKEKILCSSTCAVWVSAPGHQEVSKWAQNEC